MIAYTIFGTNDLPRAAAFYDELLAVMGAQRAIDAPRMIAWGNNPAAPMFAVATTGIWVASTMAVAVPWAGRLFTIALHPSISTVAL